MLIDTILYASELCSDIGEVNISTIQVEADKVGQIILYLCHAALEVVHVRLYTIYIGLYVVNGCLHFCQGKGYVCKIVVNVL